MDKAALRPLILDVLRRTPQTHVHAIENEIRQRAAGYERSDVLLVHETVWDLLIAGILAPGKNSLNLHLPFVHVTDFGVRCLDEGALAAEDPDGYVARIQREIGRDLPAVAADSAREAAAAFHRGLTRAAAVLLARAARSVLHDAMAAADEPSRRSTETASELAAACAVALSEARSLPTNKKEDLDAHVAGLAATVLLAEDELGRPRVPSVDRERVLGHLVLFPGQCRFVYDWVSRPGRDV